MTYITTFNTHFWLLMTWLLIVFFSFEITHTVAVFTNDEATVKKQLDMLEKFNGYLWIIILVLSLFYNVKSTTTALLWSIPVILWLNLMTAIFNAARSIIRNAVQYHRIGLGK